MAPGFKDHAFYEGKLRSDAPTGCRMSQHLLFAIASEHPDWILCSADVRAAFLKGDPYVSRTLYVRSPTRGPQLR